MTTTTPKRYSDMTQEELQESITEQEQFINKYCNVSLYDLKEEEETKEQIIKQEERIKEKYNNYLQEIKVNQKIMKENKKELKKISKRIEQNLKFKSNQEYLLKFIIEMKERLRINPDYYKNIGDLKK